MNKKQQLTIVTIITLLRAPLVLLFLAGAIINYYKPSTTLFFISFILLIMSAVTDFFDGYYARKWKVITNFGQHADPLMDKLLVVTAYPLITVLAALNGEINHSICLLVLTIFMIARDQWVTFLRSIGSIYSISGAAHWTGKVRTAFNFPLACLIFYFEAAPENIQFFPAIIIYVGEAIAIAINILSIFAYTMRYKPAIDKSLEIIEK
ncbi:MAG: CDP-alcohol phosphatidyltransferase family protein [Kiritimatiellae bacterium]|jgi:CDP-diacylglycerol--glycerol-3-phosphate 3-phosphatidyltransferase|nr:CDP-alcohol phosphatidyltransferase family protein [Kiritimatiellia bacterium]